MNYTHANKSHVFCGRLAGMPVGGWTLTSNGKSPYFIEMDGIGGTLTLKDNLILANALAVIAGTVDINDFNLTTNYIQTALSYTKGLDLGNGTITINGPQTVLISINITLFTFSAGNSTLVISPPDAAAHSFNGGGLSYNNVTQSGAGNYALTISGNNVFNVFTVDRSAAAKTLTLTAGSVQTVNNFVCATSGTTVLTINSTGAAATLTKAGAL
jgi:hypothetical protein